MGYSHIHRHWWSLMKFQEFLQSTWFISVSINWVWWAGYVPFHPTIYGSFMCLWGGDSCQDHISSERPSSIPCTGDGQRTQLRGALTEVSVHDLWVLSSPISRHVWEWDHVPAILIPRTLPWWLSQGTLTVDNSFVQSFYEASRVKCIGLRIYYASIILSTISSF